MAKGDRLRVIVLGYLVRGPLGGLAWHHLQYVLGLARLGHDVYFFEDSDDYPSCYDPARNTTDVDPTYGLRFAADAFARLGLEDRWTYYDAHQHHWHGLPANEAMTLCRTADMVLNVSGVNPLRSWMERVPVRVFIDTDPVFTQVRNLQDPGTREFAAAHTAFFSFGENFGHAGCTIPCDGFPWQPTRQPVVLDAWTSSPGPRDGPLTSVMLWDSYPSVEYEGARYGMKAESFDPYLTLPSLHADRFELAMGSRPGPRTRLEAHGWTIVDPREPTRDPWTYQAFIARSKAEFTVGKHGYVASRSGWFSERSTSYLAGGRPVVVQDTGFSDWLHADAGVLPFNTPAEALTRLDELTHTYERQCRAARAVVEEYFESDVVLGHLLATATTEPRPAAVG